MVMFLCASVYNVILCVGTCACVERERERERERESLIYITLKWVQCVEF
jgi:hypothetical protein